MLFIQKYIYKFLFNVGLTPASIIVDVLDWRHRLPAFGTGRSPVEVMREVARLRGTKTRLLTIAQRDALQFSDTPAEGHATNGLFIPTIHVEHVRPEVREMERLMMMMMTTKMTKGMTIHTVLMLSLE